MKKNEIYVGIFLNEIDENDRIGNNAYSLVNK